MIYGYARVSTATQGREGNSLEDQVAALEKYGCQEIVKEAFTGKTMDRPKFLRLLEVLQEGDTLVVCKLTASPELPARAFRPSENCSSVGFGFTS